MKILFPILITLTFVSTNVFAENKKNFGREQVLLGADPAIMKLMSKVASKVDAKLLRGEPDIQLRYSAKAFKQLCLGAGAQYPDMVATTREMTAEEFKRCQTHNVGAIIKLKIGYEALVIVANKKQAVDLHFDQKKLFLAVANDVPDEKAKRKGVLTENPNKTWKNIDSEAPDIAIKVFGPADKSRTERSVKILGLESGCRNWDWIADMKNVQRNARLYSEICHKPRKDGLYIKAEVADTDLTKHLLSDKNSIGLMDFNSWYEVKDKLKAYAIDELPVSISTISKGLYPLSRSYYVYIKMSGLENVQGVSHFMNELVSEKALAGDGYLVEVGLVAMPEKELKREMIQALEFTAMTAPDPT